MSIKIVRLQYAQMYRNPQLHMGKNFNYVIHTCYEFGIDL